MMNTMNRQIFPAYVLGALLLLLSLLAFTACDDPTQNQEIDITLRSDYSGLADAINGTGQSLSQKLALIETVLQNGFSEGQNALEMIQKVLASLSGSATEKLAAIETAVKSQTVSFQTPRHNGPCCSRRWKRWAAPPTSVCRPWRRPCGTEHWASEPSST